MNKRYDNAKQHADPNVADSTEPTPLDDDTLDQVSGGPHFRTWDGIRYDYHGGGDWGAMTGVKRGNSRQT